MNEALLRTLAAAATVLAYAALCAGIALRERQRRATHARAAAGLAHALTENDAAPPTLVLYATQTGQAKALAWRTADTLHASGAAVRVLSLNDVDAATLAQARRACIVASTYGEGDAPDGASAFAEHVLGAAPPDLRALRYAVLALGDRQYAHFCAFGRHLDEWLSRAGASREFERIDVDKGDPRALARWHAQCGGTADAHAAKGDAASIGADVVADPIDWRLTERIHLNPGSAGAPLFHLAFEPAHAHDCTAERAPRWQAGDLAQLSLASDAGRPRDYSIASIPADGQLQLLVRQERHADGSLGAASGLLTSSLALGATLALRLRPHPSFRLGENADRPLILIGNGTGMAGLRAHLRARARMGRRDNWLVFGERNRAHDALYRDDIEDWVGRGVLARLDMVFSRDQAQRVYVQHRLLQASDAVQQWLGRGAAVYVCGSLQGMAAGVDAALRQIAGAQTVQSLAASGRYRRDVY